MRSLCFVLLLLFSVGLHAQYSGFNAVTDISRFKEEFTAASKQLQSVKADFLQEKNLSMLSEKISSKGKFWFKKDNLVRMEYLQPFQYLVVINKDNVFIKDGNKENRLSSKSNKVFQQINRMMVDCVQGTALNNPDFKVSVFEGSQGWLVELLPQEKTLKEYFKKINLILSKKDYSVNKLEMYELSGDNTTISFINKELNGKMDDALFSVK